MELLNLRILRGPNYWSNNYKNLIVMKLDLQVFEDYPSNLLENFTDRLKRLMPSLYNHYCSYGEEGGFFRRLEEGTWLGHIIEHVALELQWLAGMPCGFGRTRQTGQKGVYHVVYSYELENAGIYAGEAAIRIIETLANNQDYLALEEDIAKLKDIHAHERLGPSTESIVQEAEKRGIPWSRLDHDSFIMLGQGCHQQLICSTVTSRTSSIGVDLVADKAGTKQLLADSHIPVPHGLVITSLSEISKAIKELGFPLVIKPQKSNHGKGITTDINSKEKAILAFQYAKKFSNEIIVEHYVNGFDYRLLIVNHQLVAAAKRTPACIIGDGKNCIQHLIDETNSHPHRGKGHQNILTKIEVDEVTLSILAENDMTLETIIAKGQIVYLKNAANLSSGGTAVDVTHLVHPHNKVLAERIARLVNLDICGIDLIAMDISKPINERNGAVIEVNAGPGFRMHLSPTAGEKRNVAKPVIDMLFPKSKPSRIPIVAVTGTNGKTTTVRLIAHFARCAGHTVGYTTTEGIYLQGKQIYEGDCSGPRSAHVILRDPVVDFAVFECARGGILREGLGFDRCSISILTNVSEDHLGLDDIDNLEQMARVKSVVPYSTLPHGCSILNADDDLVYALKNELSCEIALFSIDDNNPRIQEHCLEGGLAAYIKDEAVMLQRGKRVEYVAALDDIPLTLSGFASCMVKNVLPAVLAGIASGFSVEELRQWLFSFDPTPENLPGRMNLITFDNFKVLIDYAHNEKAFLELKEFMNKVRSPKKVGIIACTGDRREIDIWKVGYYAAQTFDEIIIREDRDSRGRSHKELTKMVKDGIAKVDSNKKVRVISNEFEAIQYAMDHAIPDTFIFYFPDEILKAIEYVKRSAQESAVNSDLVKGQAS